MSYHLQQSLGKFSGISLARLDEVNFSEREVVKSVFPLSKLPELLESLLPYYRVLDINGRRIFHYETVYLDTPTLKAYKDHQRGKPLRYKFRFRTYVESGSSFFEIKSRSGRGASRKIRLPAEGAPLTITPAIRQIVSRQAGTEADKLMPTLRVNIQRITLLHLNNREKVTFDFDIRFSLDSSEKTLRNLVIAEVKQLRPDPASEIFHTQRKLKIYPLSFSKYCIGIAILHDDVKKNNFKESLLRIRKITAAP